MCRAKRGCVVVELVLQQQTRLVSDIKQSHILGPKQTGRRCLHSACQSVDGGGRGLLKEEISKLSRCRLSCQSLDCRSSLSFFSPEEEEELYRSAPAGSEAKGIFLREKKDLPDKISFSIT